MSNKNLVPYLDKQTPGNNRLLLIELMKQGKSIPMLIVGDYSLCTYFPFIILPRGYNSNVITRVCVPSL